MAIVIPLALAVFVAAAVIVWRARNRRAAGPGDDPLLHIYAHGGFHPPSERLVGDGESGAAHAAGWAAQEDIARLYVPLGLKPKHEDGSEPPSQTLPGLIPNPTLPPDAQERR